MMKDEKQNKGKVWLVGAGPWDQGLFTIKGKEVLEAAQVVVYDKLVGQGILSMMPKDAKKIDVGKRKGNHPVPQAEINEILLQEALAGNRVVRLKGGDPFLFGRGGEELELLTKHSIPFEIIPGVTSAIAVPAYHGIPVTHRDFVSSLHIITGHTRKAETAEIDYEALVRLKGTLVFLMGISALSSICKGLMAAGMNPEMPAALLERGTSAHQRRVVSTLAHLTEDGAKANIQTPAIIVVGQVCRLAADFHWAEDRPLGHLKIMVTRPKDRESALAANLRAYGAEVLEMPTIETLQILENTELESALKRIDTYDWIVFTSIYSVKVFFDTLWERKLDIRRLSGIKLAAVGPATQNALEEKGLLVDLMPEAHYGDALGQQLAERILAEEEKTGERRRVLLPRAKMGTANVTAPLAQAGIFYDDIPLYDTVENPSDDIIKYDDSVDYVAFASSSAVRGFVKRHPDLDYAGVRALCIGKETAKEAEACGMGIIMAEKPTTESMVEAFLALAAEAKG